MIDITFIGTGALMPLPERALCSVFLKVTGKSILFDCGEGTQSAAKKAGVNLQNLTMIALSHYHGDHILGLPGLLQSLSCFQREEPLYITGPEGLSEELAPILKLCSEVLFEIRLIEIPEEGLDLYEFGFPFGAKLLAFSTNHRVSSQGYRFELSRAGKFIKEKADTLSVPLPLRSRLQKGESVSVDGRIIRPDEVMDKARKGLCVVYSGDTAPCDSLTDSAKGADLFICEATFGENAHEDKAKERGHMTFKNAALTAKNAGVRELFLIHFSPRVTDPAEYLINAAGVFSPTHIAEDGMTLKLEYDE